VRVHAGGEVHDLEVALNKVQDSALSLAVEQATLRRNVADAYINLGRRNQNLVSRQLEFITQLENDESDPETLEHLFRLDHLATRMRRNAESLLVLAGLAPPRTWSAPVAVGDVVRGALGEVEGYRRVRLRHVDDARVDGAAAADVSHVIAELVENALSFSPPDADVEVYGRRGDHSYVVTIVDSGIGMHDDELERANRLISSASALTLAPSRFLGHYVVAQLAARHGLTVHIAASPAGGLTATVALPAVLLGLENAPSIEGPDDATAPTAPIAPATEPERPVVGLPRRETAATDTPARLAPRGSGAPIAFRATPAPPPLPRDLAPEPARELQLVASTNEADEVDERDGFDQGDGFDNDDGLDEIDGFDNQPAPVVDSEPEPEPEAEAEAEAGPEPAAAPAPPARPRLGLGTFADLRGAVQPSSPSRETIAPTTEPARPAAEPVGTTPVPAPPLPTPPLIAGPDRPPLVAPDRRPSFAEVSDAVDAAAGRSAPELPSPLSEDLLPQRLPKRGRRSSRLETPWTRERPVVSEPATAAATMAPAPPLANPAPLPSRRGSGESEVEAGSAEAANRASVPPPEAAAGSSAESGERFAFFAAFRAAAEQAREEAGIDDRRRH
jgi:anti-sigma regulatory factor (Ser/Thr protein kinase)